MFQIITTNTLPDIYFENKQSISVPCFYLTNDNSSTTAIELTNFAPLFKIENTDEQILDMKDFNYFFSSIPSEFQMLEININDLQPIEDISTLYLNGVFYQNLLDVDNLIIFNSEEDTVSLEEREST